MDMLYLNASYPSYQHLEDAMFRFHVYVEGVATAKQEATAPVEI